jgi:hypothetical protein
MIAALRGSSNPFDNLAARDPQTSHSFCESLPRQAQLPSRQRTAPAVPCECRGHRHSFALRARAVERDRWLQQRDARVGQYAFDMTRAHASALRRQHHESGNHVLQLADVAWPTVTDEASQGIRSENHTLPCFSRHPAPEQVRKHGHILCPLAEGRQTKPHDGQTEEQVISKLAASRHLR